MSHPLVVNLHRAKYDVYIGRAGKGQPGPWGNPFHLRQGCTFAERMESIALYRQHLLASPELLRRLPELRGKVLGCFCAPLPCHGDVLAELANAGSSEEQTSLFGEGGNL